MNIAAISAHVGSIRGSLSLALRLARRELRGGLKGFRVFLACLILGVTAIAAIGSISESLLTGLKENGRVLLGGDLDLRLAHQKATDDQLRWLTERGEVSVITNLRTMARGTGPDARRILVELRAIDSHYPLLGEAVLSPPLSFDAALASRDGSWGAVVDSGLLSRLNLAIGQTVRVGEVDYEIRATMERDPDRATHAIGFGPNFVVAAASLGNTGLIQPGSLVHYHYRLRLNDPAVAPRVRSALNEKFPEAGWRIRSADEAAPGVGQFIERLTLFMTLVGLTALLVGGVGIGNAVRAYLEGRIATIATLKCLGAPGRLIFQVYLLQIMILAMAGVLVGLALGAAGPFLVQAVAGDLLGWQAQSRIYPIPLAAAAAFGLLIALAFSLWPLARAKLVPAASLFRDLVAPLRQRASTATIATIGLTAVALASLVVITASDRRFALWFVLGSVGALLLFRLLAVGVTALARSVRNVRSPGLRLALANLHRPGSPTASVILSLGLGVTLLVAIALIEGNLTRQVEQNLPEEAPAFYFIDIQPDQIEAFDGLVRGVAGARDLRRVPMLRGRITTVGGLSPDQLTIPSEIAWVFRGDRGLTWSREAPEGVQLTAGSWWAADYGGPPLVSLDAQVGAALGVGPGDHIGINVLGRDIEVTIANLRVIDWSNLDINFVMVFSPGLLETAPQTYIATVKATAEAEDPLERAVTDRFINVSSIRVKEALATIATLLVQIATVVRAIAAVALLAGVFVLAGAVAAGHHRRVYESVVLKVLGATRATVTRAFLIEYGLLGLATAAVAVLLGSLIAYLVLTEIMHIDFILLPGTIVTTALMATAVTLALGFAGTWRALGHKAAPLLRNE